MKKILPLLLVLFAGNLQAAEFSEAYDISARGFEREADLIVAYYQSGSPLDLEQQSKNLEYISRLLSQLEAEYKNNPVFRFVQGLHARNVASLRQQQGKTGAADRQLKKKRDYYVQAMQLDKKQTPNLSAAVYATIKKGLLGVEKQQAIESELKLGGSGENDSYYWYLHWSNINELQKQGKIEEAKNALARMKEEIEKSGQQTEIYKQLAEKAHEDIERAIDKLSETKKKITVKPERKHKAFTEEQVDDEYYGYLLIVGIIMLVLIIIVLVFELRRRKNR